MEVPAMPDAANEPQFLQPIRRPHDRATAHANQLSDAIQARVALPGSPVEMIDDRGRNPLFRVR